MNVSEKYTASIFRVEDNTAEQWHSYKEHNINTEYITAVTIIKILKNVCGRRDTKHRFK
jgi:hypothetical protein